MSRICPSTSRTPVPGVFGSSRRWAIQFPTGSTGTASWVPIGRLTPGLRLSPMWCLGRLRKCLVRRRRHGIFFRSASLDRILVETDASYQKHCPVGGMGPPVATPFHVGIVYKWLAGLRDVDNLTQISRTVNADFMDFYEIDVSRPSDQ